MQPCYVIDTHVWVWQLFNPKRLSVSVVAILEAADRFEVQIVVPVVVLAEMSMIAQKQRVQGFNANHLPLVVSAVEAHPAYRLSVLSADLILSSQSFRQIPDVFDRLIATEAVSLGAHLLTRDPVIAASGLVRTVW